MFAGGCLELTSSVRAHVMVGLVVSKPAPMNAATSAITRRSLSGWPLTGSTADKMWAAEKQAPGRPHTLADTASRLCQRGLQARTRRELLIVSAQKFCAGKKPTSCGCRCPVCQQRGQLSQHRHGGAPAMVWGSGGCCRILLTLSAATADCLAEQRRCRRTSGSHSCNMCRGLLSCRAGRQAGQLCLLGLLWSWSKQPAALKSFMGAG